MELKPGSIVDLGDVVLKVIKSDSRVQCSRCYFNCTKDGKFKCCNLKFDLTGECNSRFRKFRDAVSFKKVANPYVLPSEEGLDESYDPPEGKYDEFGGFGKEESTK